jgi:hypothetical protein
MQSKVTANINYDKIKDEILQLECELAFLCGRLSDVSLPECSKIEAQAKFLDISGKLRECRDAISSGKVYKNTLHSKPSWYA